MEYIFNCFSLPQLFRCCTPLILVMNNLWGASRAIIPCNLYGDQRWQQYSSLGISRAFHRVFKKCFSLVVKVLNIHPLILLADSAIVVICWEKFPPLLIRTGYWTYCQLPFSSIHYYRSKGLQNFSLFSAMLFVCAQCSTLLLQSVPGLCLCSLCGL